MTYHLHDPVKITDFTLSKEIRDKHSEVLEDLAKAISDHRETQIRGILVAHGWTPPPEPLPPTDSLRAVNDYHAALPTKHRDIEDIKKQVREHLADAHIEQHHDL